jgi:hypothetical protein
MAAIVGLQLGIAQAGTGDWTAGNVGGIYALGSIVYLKFKGCPNGCVDAGVKANSSVPGIYLRYHWKDIETGDGTYDWSTVDNEVAVGAAAGKKVSISVDTGAFAPAWLFTEGVSTFSFKWTASWGFTPCTVQKMPRPWDPVFLAKWGSFVSAFGARYDTNPALTTVKLTGFSSRTPELFLPTDVRKQINVSGKSCTTYDDVTNWQAAGYTRTKAESAWNTIAADFFTAFKHTAVAAMMEPADFPPIDQNGNIMNVNSGEDDTANTDVISKTIGLYGQQFILQNDGLSKTWIWQTEKSYASQINTGYQMVKFTMGTELPAAVSLGLKGAPTIFEISTPDIDDTTLAGTIRTAAAGLP